MIRVDDGATQQLDTLLRFVAPEVPQVPYEMALDMVREAYKEFARKSRLLGAVISLPIQRGVIDYDLDVPDGYDLFAVKVGSHDRYCWREPSPHYWYNCCGYRYRMDGNSRVILADAPSRDGTTFDLTVQVIPSDCAVEIPVAIAGPYGRGIAMGAVADMLEMPGKAWTNPRLAQMKRSRFNNTCAQGRALDITDHGARQPRMPDIRIL